jgi:hypothetical protein
MRNMFTSDVAGSRLLQATASGTVDESLPTLHLAQRLCQFRAFAARSDEDER